MSSTPIVGTPILLRKVTAQFQKVNKPLNKHYHNSRDEYGANVDRQDGQYENNRPAPRYNNNSNNGHYNGNYGRQYSNYGRYHSSNNSQRLGWNNQQSISQDNIVATQSRPLMSATTCATTPDNFPETLSATPTSASASSSHDMNSNATTISSSSVNAATVEVPSYRAKPPVQNLPPNMTSQKFPQTTKPHYYPEGFTNNNPNDDRVQLYVHDDDSVDSFLDLCQGEEYLAIDLEFSSFGNYRPTLQLAQIATRYSVIGLIDFQALGDKALPIVELIASKKAIMFGCNSDLAILDSLEEQFDISGLPREIHDAQVAASFLSLGEFNGRSNLGSCVENVLGVKLEKGYGGSDWSRRPLSLEQIEYAMDDVRHLHTMYDSLMKMLHDEPEIQTNSGAKLPSRYELYRSEMRDLLVNPAATVNPNEAWMGLKGIPSHATAEQLGIMRQLAKWREHEAARLNRFARSVMRDEIIVGLGTKPPTSIEDMNLFMSTTQGYFSATNAVLFELIKDATPVDESSMALYTPRADRTTEYIRQATQLVLLGISHMARIDAEFLANFNEMKRFCSLKTEEEEDRLPMFQGFRRELVGLPLRAVKRGANVTFSVNAPNKQLNLSVD